MFTLLDDQRCDRRVESDHPSFSLDLHHLEKGCEEDQTIRQDSSYLDDGSDCSIVSAGFDYHTSYFIPLLRSLAGSFCAEHSIIDAYLERAAEERYEAQTHPASGKSGMRSGS